MGAVITLAGESLIAQRHADNAGLKVSRFIFANVPGLNPNTPVDRAAPKPPAGQIVNVYDIPASHAGYVNPNQVVYSAQIGSDVGDWDFNWIGLETIEGVLFAVAYVPLQQKRRNIPPLQIGNNLTRNFLLAFDGALALTGITIDASTWQHDFTVRLAGIDERERQSNRDVYGRACFFGGSLQLEKVGSAYQLKPGTAYVEGIRLLRSTALAVVPPALPNTVWLDVALQRELNDLVPRWQVVFGAAKTDYVDSAGVQHYCVAIADVQSSGALIDRRSIEPITGPLVAHFAARTGNYEFLRARATTKADVGLGNLPNAKTDDPQTNDKEVLASSVAVRSLYDELHIDSRPGNYFKVEINERGQVLRGSTPTTVDGFGITDALKVGTMSQQRPSLASPSIGSTYSDVAIEIREAQGNLDEHLDLSHAPAIGFHWGNRAARRLAMDWNADLLWGESGKIWHSDNLNLAEQACPQRLQQDILIASVSNTQIRVRAGELVLKRATDSRPKLIFGSDLTLTTGAGIGENKLDTGAWTDSTWYYLWVCFSDHPYLVASTSSVAPAVSATTYRTLAGCFRLDASSVVVPFIQQGGDISLRPQLVFTNVYPPANYTAVSLGSLIPPIARTARGVIGSNGGGNFYAERSVAADPSGLGACYLNIFAASNQAPVDGYIAAGPWNVPIITPQTVYWYGPDTVNPEGRMHVCGYQI